MTALRQLRRVSISVLLAASMLLPSSQVAAQEQGVAEDAAVGRRGIRAIVRGLYLETQVGGGYTTGRPVQDGRIEQNLKGREGDGASVLLGLNLGYDVNELISVQLMAGLSLVSNRRRRKIRDISISYAGAGVRLALPLSERLHFNLSAGGGFASYTNAVDPIDEVPEDLTEEQLDEFYETSSKTSGGPMIMAGVDLEYFVHVRHFSVGVRVSVLVPVSPFRLGAHLTPFLKYTF